VLILVLGAVTAEWLRQPALRWVVAAWLAAVFGLAALRPWRGLRRGALASATLALLAGLTIAHYRVHAVEHHWPEERAALVAAAGRAATRELHAAYHAAERLAATAAEIGEDEREAAFGRLDRAVPDLGPEMGVVVLDPARIPWAWGGRHRLRPAATGDSIEVRAAGYYVVLEARRHSPNGRVAVASVLVWAHPSVPEQERSLAEQIRRRTDVAFAVYTPGEAPADPDLIRYREPGPGSHTLLALLPAPPEQGAARQLTFQRGGGPLTWLLLLILVAGVAFARRPAERYLLLATAVWVAARAPLGVLLGAQALFSPATFFRSTLGPLSSSAGLLALTGVVLTCGALWLWRQRPRRRSWGIGLGLFLLLATPGFVAELARGITPPARGAAPGLWLTWELTLLFAAAVPIATAAALFRGTAAVMAARTRLRIWVGIGIAVVASVVGMLAWSPNYGWPDWYPLLWVPALILVTLPASRSTTIAAIGIVAGSFAALVTWGAELSGRLQVAQRDVARLGGEPDPLAVPLLEGFGELIRAGRPPQTASALYAFWAASQLGEESYPAHLALWSNTGQLQAEVPLDSLDLPTPFLASLVRAMPAAQTQVVTQLRRVPGVHYLLLVRTRPGAVVSVGVGPRSRLVASGRLGRLLDPERRQLSLYRLTLAPPGPEVASVREVLHWRREGWYLRADGRLDLPGGTRRIHAEIDLRGPFPLFVRGLLVVLFDVAVLALVWAVGEFVAGAPWPRLRWRTSARSFRVRLAFTLAAFFIVPAVGFSVWGFARLAAEAERGRDLLITQTLRDAVAGAPELARAPDVDLDRALDDVSRRVGADLAIYRGGALAATSAPVLQDLGVVSHLMDASAFRTLAFQGQLEVTRPGPIPSLGERVGFRTVRPGPPAALEVLATPQLADESALAARQLDLGLVLLLATIVGVAAAVGGARRAALFLSRPVSELRRSAIALGKGQAMPSHSAHPPLEFEPVFGAFERMAADIRSSQAALEAARRRTATVLGTVTTGVVGLDSQGRVIIANRQAVDLLGIPLAEGDRFVEHLSEQWRPLAHAVRSFLLGVTADETGAELTAGGRRMTFQLASLGPDLRGAVLALNDVTDLSRAERVLAWGEMARQVAHEIKNPLTPMRLGMQHLRRVWRDGRDDFDGVLEETAGRILAEIDRLDTIARAFSRFGAPAAGQEPLERLDLGTVAEEVVQLYRLAEEGTDVRLEVHAPAWGEARRDEVKEVLVNLLENARNAAATRITVRASLGCLQVTDDGEGIAAELLPRIFEPRFSTTTSGSGLGLPIVRRLVEGWGGEVEVSSAEGAGTTVTIRLPPSPARAA
jgi:two-component system nitrogen regulation sensor histidine kinase NtrY